jgi:TonB family protein
MPTSVRYGFRISAVLAAALSSGICTEAQGPQTPLTITSEQQVQLRELTSRILQHADSAGCKKNSCTILVANFGGPTGATSTLGMQLADAVSAEFAAQAKGVQIVDRQKLRQYLEKERIASKLLEDDNAARWLAKENGATAVLVGYLRGNQQQKVLRVQLLDTRDFAKKNPTPKGPVAEETINDLGYPGDLDPVEPFGAPPKTELAGETLESLEGSVPPNCPNHRDPDYTEAARQARFNGGLVLQAVFLKDGRVTNLRPLKGAPFGLNQSAEQVAREWKCEPATKDGKPVTVSVPVEFTFRVY